MLADFTHARACNPICEKSLTPRIPICCYSAPLPLTLLHYTNIPKKPPYGDFFDRLNRAGFCYDRSRLCSFFKENLLTYTLRYTLWILVIFHQRGQSQPVLHHSVIHCQHFIFFVMDFSIKDISSHITPM